MSNCFSRLYGRMCRYPSGPKLYATLLLAGLLLFNWAGSLFMPRLDVLLSLGFILPMMSNRVADSLLRRMGNGPLSLAAAALVALLGLTSTALLWTALTLVVMALASVFYPGGIDRPKWHSTKKHLA